MTVSCQLLPVAQVMGSVAVPFAAVKVKLYAFTAVDILVSVTFPELRYVPVAEEQARRTSTLRVAVASEARYSVTGTEALIVTFEANTGFSADVYDPPVLARVWVPVNPVGFVRDSFHVGVDVPSYK